MKISIITLFPQFFKETFNFSILKRAQDKGLVEFKIIDHREFGLGKHKIVDNRPYGGGAGMVLRVDVLKKAIDSAKIGVKGEKVVLLCPQGDVYTQKRAEELSKLKHLVLVNGHYEGFDERIKNFVDLEVSIGDYILTGGEIPSLALVDSIVRLLPGVLKDKNATVFESHSKINGSRILEGASYTRPEDFNGLLVPKVFLSGDPKKISEHKILLAYNKTRKKRPDLIKKSKS